MDALHPKAQAILQTRNNVAAIREAITRLELAHRFTDGHTTARELGNALTMARRALALETGALRNLAPEVADELLGPSRYHLTEEGQRLLRLRADALDHEASDAEARRADAPQASPGTCSKGVSLDEPYATHRDHGCPEAG